MTAPAVWTSGLVLVVTCAVVVAVEAFVWMRGGE